MFVLILTRIELIFFLVACTVFRIEDEIKVGNSLMLLLSSAYPEEFPVSRALPERS